MFRLSNAEHSAGVDEYNIDGDDADVDVDGAADAAYNHQRYRAPYVLSSRSVFCARVEGQFQRLCNGALVQYDVLVVFT